MRMILMVFISMLMIAAAAAGESVRAPEGLAHVERQGRGEIDLVLIPGLAADWRVWEEFMERNGDRYTMYAVTLRGFGGDHMDPPEDPDGSPLLDMAVEGVAALIRMHELDRPFVMGHSMGGHIALRMGIERPGLIEGVIDVDGYVVAPLQWDLPSEERRRFVDQQFVPQIRAMGGGMWLEQFKGSAPTMVRDRQRAEQLSSMMDSADGEAVAQYVVEMFRADLRPALGDLAAPALVLAATPEMPGVGQDEHFWRETTHGAPDLELIFIDRSRHFIMDDQPEALDKRVREFTN